MSSISQLSFIHRTTAFFRSIAIDSPRWLFNSVCFVIGTAFMGWLALSVFNGVPRLDDSVATVYQAKLFLEGRLTWTVPIELKPWFKVFGVITPLGQPGEWASMYPPGLSLLMVPGVVFGVVWMVNPVCGGLLVVMISELARELFDETTARVAGLLALASPYLVTVSATHLSHTSAALLCVVAWYCTCRLLRAPAGSGTAMAIFAGGAIGYAILIRPEAALICGIAIALGVIVQWRAALPRWRLCLIAAGVALIGVVILVAYQHVVFGKAGMQGHYVEMGDDARLGINRIINDSYHFTHPKAEAHAVARAKALYDNLLGWPVPAAILLFAPFFFWRGVSKGLWLLVPLAGFSTLFYYFWYWEEWLPGRYLFPALPFLVVLAAHGWVGWRERLKALPALRALPVIALVAGTIWSFALAGPEYRQFFAPHHADVEDWLEPMMKAHKVSNALVIIRSERTYRSGTRNDYFATAFRLNSLTLDGDIVFVRDGETKKVNRDNSEIIALYPDRNYYMYIFDQARKRARLNRIILKDGKISELQPLPWVPVTIQRRLFDRD